MIRVIVFWGLYWGPPIVGNYHILKLASGPGVVGDLHLTSPATAYTRSALGILYASFEGRVSTGYCNKELFSSV